MYIWICLAYLISDVLPKLALYYLNDILLLNHPLTDWLPRYKRCGGFLGITTSDIIQRNVHCSLKRQHDLLFLFYRSAHRSLNRVDTRLAMELPKNEAHLQKFVFALQGVCMYIASFNSVAEYLHQVIGWLHERSRGLWKKQWSHSSSYLTVLGVQGPSTCFKIQKRIERKSDIVAERWEEMLSLFNECIWCVRVWDRFSSSHGGSSQYV